MTDLVKPLKEMRQLLSDLRNWTKHASARDIWDEPISPTNIGATCWCLSGAANKAVNGDAQMRIKIHHELQNAILAVHNRPASVAYFNDYMAMHKDIVNVLDVAIAINQAKGEMT